MFASVQVVGHGRVGSAISARLSERGVLGPTDCSAALVILCVLCVPDTAIADAAAAVAIGPWIAHVSGATSIRALAPHVLRFTMHPLQTFRPGGGPQQLDGACAAVAGECDDARRRGFWLASLLGLKPFEIPDHTRALYHAGAVFASNYIVTLYRAAKHLFELTGAPPEALHLLIQRTVVNRFELTGPIARGDSTTVEAHLTAIREHAPELESLYRALADRTGR
jgi:predicted short-subunit dehydrogenase-like oxidoreductase (DUF2520 family)